MAEYIAVAISVFSLFVSVLIAWLTLLRSGTVKMTQPTVIYFGPDSPRRDRPALPKVFLRTLLFATSKRGRVVESMHVALARNETKQNLNIWVYGDDKLVRGSGLFVGETGVATNHHFLAPEDSSFRFTEGRYRIDVYAKLVGDRGKLLLFSQTLEVSSELAAQLRGSDSGLYFDWGPDSSRYLPHIDRRPALPIGGFRELQDSTQWNIETDTAHFDKLKTQESFWQLVTLARSVNALRFVHVALLDHKDDGDTTRANRTRFNSFFFNCALLYEALLLLERLPKHYRNVPSFEKLHEILKDPVATELRSWFVSGEGEATTSVYYQLADVCALGVFAGFSLDEPETLKKLTKRFAEATDLAVRFINAAEGFIGDVLHAEGWRLQDVGPRNLSRLERPQ